MAEHDFDENEELQIKLDDMDNKLYLDWNNQLFVEYDLLDVDTLEPINNGDILIRYTKDNVERKRCKLKVREKPSCMGRYSATISFLINYITN